MPLTPEEERRLFQEMMEGKEAKKRLETENALNQEEKGKLEELVKKGEVAREELILSLERLIHSIAKRLHKPDDNDLIQKGWEAAIKAVDAYDPNKGARLATFAYPKIEGAMKNYLDKVRKVCEREVSLDSEPEGEEGEMLELRVPSSGETFSEDKILLKILLDRAIDQLPEDLKKVIMKKYFYEETDREIAKQMGVSLATISRREKEALEKLREILGVEI
jgi:RNA polymerase sporulation-specific sigma factor